MARADVIQTNFTSGEVSPLMRGRVDIQKYANGARELMNFVVRPQGGITRRSGTKYLGTTKSGNYSRLRKFVFSNSQAYILEFTDLFVRVWTSGAVTATIATPYLSAEIDSLYFAQSLDQLFIASPTHPPQILSRFSDSSWTLTPYIQTNYSEFGFMDGPYIDVDTTGNQAQLSLVSDTCTATNNSTISVVQTCTASAAVFSAGSVGKYIYLPNNVVGQQLFLVTVYVSTTQVRGTYVTPPSISDLTQYGGFITFSTGVLSSIAPIFNSGMTGLIAKTQNVSTITFYLLGTFLNEIAMDATALTMITGATFTISSNLWAVGQYVEYLDGDSWALALITAVTNQNQATVQIIPNIVIHDDSVNVTIGTTTATSSFSGVFSPNMIGMYVRDTSTQKWGVITAYNTSSSVNVTVLALFQYAYPLTTITIQNNRVITANVVFTSPVIDPTDVGTQFRFQFGSQWRSFVITQVSGNTSAIGYLSDFLPFDTKNSTGSPYAPYNGGFADNFRMGAWRQLFGYPGIVCFHDQRLVFGNTGSQPNTFWMSQPSDFYNHAPTDEDGLVTDASAITVTLSSGKADPVSWMLSSQVFMVGTFGNEWEIVAPSSASGLSPTNIGAFSQSSFGSLSPTDAFRFGVAVLFIQRGGNKIREGVYQFQYDSFNFRDITILSEHILRVRGGAKIMDHQIDPVSIFWIVTNNGKLVGMTYDRDQEVVGFHPHDLGGSVESVAVIPNGSRDDVYVVVNRTLNGVTTRCMELIQPLFDSDTGDTTTTAQFLDCSKTYSGAATSVLTGYNYLANMSVRVVGNGIDMGNFTVSNSGTITLPSQITTAVVGFQNNAWIRSLDPEGGAQSGTSQGKQKRISQMVARVKDSLQFQQGPAIDQLTDIDVFSLNSSETPTPNNLQNQLYTGDVKFSVDQAWDTGASYYIYQNRPYPITIISIMPQLNTNA